MPPRLNPTPEQQAAIRAIAEDDGPGAIVGAEIGAGKTLITVEGSLERFPRRVLITAPLPVYENWRDSLAAQTDGQARLRACGKTKYAGIPAKELKANLDDFMAGKDGFYFMGREFWLAQDWYTSNEMDAKGRYRRKRRGIYNKHPVDVLIFDEAHFAASRDSRGYKTFMYQKADYKVAVSGTYFGNKFENAYTIPHAIWGDSLTDTFALWRARYAATKYSPHTYDHVEVTGELEPGKWVKDLPNYLFIEGHKGEVIEESHFVDLYPSQRRVYDALDRDFAAKAESGEWIIADLAATAHIRLRQVAVADIDIEEGFEIRDGFKTPKDLVVFPEDGRSAKFDELLRLLRDLNDPAVITLDFAQAAIRFNQWLKAKGLESGLWAGKKHVPDDERMRLKESFMTGYTQFLVGVPAAMGTGVDGLQKICNRMYTISEFQDGVGREQTHGRLNRRGQERPVYITNIHARDTIDLDITQSLSWKAIENAQSRALDTKLARA